jgi:sigma-B regulation protein RsbQ
MNVIERNNVTVRGQGSASLIFAHGYGCNQNMWRLVAPAFEKHHQIVLFDHVGAGASDIAAYDRIKYGTLHGYAQDVLEICRSLELNNPIFVGHSVSAMIGVLSSLADPSALGGLVLIGPSPCYVNHEDYRGGFDRDKLEQLLQSLESNFIDWSRVMAPVIMGNLEHPELSQELVQSFCETKPEIAKHFARVTFQSDDRHHLAQVRIPTLILQCSQDPIAPDAVGSFVHQKIQGSRLVKLMATGHCPHISAPEETIQEIQKFLQTSF